MGINRRYTSLGVPWFLPGIYKQSFYWVVRQCWWWSCCCSACGHATAQCASRCIQTPLYLMWDLEPCPKQHKHIPSEHWFLADLWHAIDEHTSLAKKMVENTHSHTQKTETDSFWMCLFSRCQHFKFATMKLPNLGGLVFKLGRIS